MSEPVGEQNLYAVSSEGLDEIFSAEPLPFHDQSDSLAEPLHMGDATLSQGLSFKDACIHYCVKPTALRSRIKSGKVFAKKIDGPNGPEWRIYPEALARPLRDCGVTEAAPSHNPNAPVAQAFRAGIDDRLLNMVDDLQTKLDRANKELQAANYRVGYLENQVTERERDIKELDSTVKLITDSQHKRSGLSRFWSWLMVGKK